LHGALHDMLPAEKIQKHTDRAVIEIAPLACLRARTRPLTETSLIVHCLTTSLGRIATVAKAARPRQITISRQTRFVLSRGF
jgi:hypothetical protein